MALERHEIAFTERQLRFIDAIRRTGRGGIDRNDIVRRALDARIQKFIDDGAIAEKDGGEPESDGKKSGTDADKESAGKSKTEG